jgi:hypothetical protein
MPRAVDVRYTQGVRLGALTIDPTGRARAAFWTHRPAHRHAARHTMASAPLAGTWRDVLAIPFGGSVVAMGLRLELLPTGYGPGGAALLLANEGRRTLVVGPTTERLESRHAERLVLAAPSVPGDDGAWLAEAAAGRTPLLVVPDAAAAEVVSARLRDAGVAHRRPPWLGPGEGKATVRLTTRGPGRLVDARPQAPEPWLVDYALQVAPEQVLVHGPRAEPLAMALAAAGLAVRVLHAPHQLAFAALTTPPVATL